MIDVKAVKDDEIRLKRCEENYSRIDLMHRFIMQKLEMLEKLIEGEGDKQAVEQETIRASNVLDKESCCPRQDKTLNMVLTQTTFVGSVKSMKPLGC